MSIFQRAVCDMASSPPGNHAPAPWQEILKKRWGEGIYRDWFQSLSWGRQDEDVVVFFVDSPFIRDWIQTHYWEEFTTLLLALFPAQRLSLEVNPQASWKTGESSSSVSAVANFSAHSSLRPSTLLEASHPTEDFPTVPLNPSLTFDTFVVGRPNEFAYAAARRVAEASQPLYNPLFLYGPVGHGKTHLLHSIAQDILARWGGKRTVMYLSAEKFMYHFIKALRYKNVMAFKERFRSVDTLIIDDVQFIGGKESTQEEFFHTFNALVEQGGQLVISADKAPADLNGLQDRMRSRLGWGLVADLHPSTYELRLMVLHKKVKHLTVTVGEEVLQWLAAKITSNIRELEGALVRLAAHASLVGREVNLSMAAEVLKDLVRAHCKEITLEDIQKKVADYYLMRVTDLSSPKRCRAIVRPRQVAMLLAKQLTTLSFPAIGRAFGGRDHTTVMHAIQTMTQLAEKDSALQNDVHLLRQSLEHG